MFLQMLTQPEQSVFCQLAYAVMLADGQLDEKEAAFYERSQLDLELEELPPPAEGGEIDIPDGAFTVAVSRHALLLELCLLAAADDVVTEDEHRVLADIASDLGVEGRRLERYLEYAHRLRQTLDEGVTLLGEGD